MAFQRARHAIHPSLLLQRRRTSRGSDLPAEVQCGSGPAPAAAAAASAAGSLELMERQHIVATLKQVDGHRGKAAALLGIDPKTLYRKLLSYGITADTLRS